MDRFGVDPPSPEWEAANRGWRDVPPDDARWRPRRDDPDGNLGAESPETDQDQKPGDTTHRLLIGEPASSEADIPRRVYVVPGYIQRGVVTEVVGPGGHGKSQLFLAWGVALALGRPFGGFVPTCPMKVITLDVEDDLDEQRRRAAAIMRHFGVTSTALKGNLLLLTPSGAGMLLTLHPDTRKLHRTELHADLCEAINAFQPDLVMLNPLGELHDAQENDNSALRHVISDLRTIAREKDIGLLVGHHTRKGIPEPGNPDAGRGASSITGAVRKSFTLYQMTDTEADHWKISRPDMYFRIDGAKANHDAKNGTEWFERVVHELENGDFVAAPAPWTPPHEAVTTETIQSLLVIVKMGDHGQPWTKRLGQYDRSISRAMEKLGISSRDGQQNALHQLFEAGVSECAWTKPNRMPAMGLRHPDGGPDVRWKE